MTLKKIKKFGTDYDSDEIVARAKDVNPIIDVVNAMTDGTSTAAAFSSITVDTIAETTSGNGVTVDSVLIKDGAVDLNGAADALILDADGDTTISADTEDTINFEINGADDFQMTANTFTALSGSTIATNTIAETTAGSGVTVDGVLVKDGGIVCADAATLEVDVVNEATAAAGVTVDGMLIKDGACKPSSVQLPTPYGTAASNVTTVEYGDGRNITTTLSFTDLVIGAPTAGGDSAHGVLIHTLPQTTPLLVNSISIVVGLTLGSVTTDTPDVGLGSTQANGAVATLDGTGTFEDIMTGQTWPGTLDGTLDYYAVIPGGSVATDATIFPLMKASTAKPIYLNAADGWNAGVTGNLTATGTIVINYTLIA